MTVFRISMNRKYEDAKHSSTFCTAWKSEIQAFLIIYDVNHYLLSPLLQYPIDRIYLQEFYEFLAIELH